MARGKPHNPVSSSRKMTETEKEVAQWRIDVTLPSPPDDPPLQPIALRSGHCFRLALEPVGPDQHLDAN